MADRSVKVVLGANVTGLVNGMRTAQRATQDYAKSAMGYYKQNQAQLDQIGSTALVVGAGLTAMAGFAVKSAMDWEVAWTGVLKTVDGTPAQLAKVEDGLRDLATTTGFAHTEVAAVGEAAGQLGISTDGVVKFTDTMLAMGVSTNLSAEEAATGLARFRNIMGSSEAEVSNMGSTIVALGNNFATTDAEILAMSLRLAGAGRQAGFTEAEVMGVATAMSSVGIEAEAGGTAMSLTMKRIGREVENGGGKLDMFAQIAGMSAGDFKAAWEDDAAGALTTFVAGLDKTEQMGKSTNAVLTELGITGIRESDALLRLSASSEQMADALGVATEGWAQNIALMDEADKFYNTTAQKGKQAWAEIKDAAITAGDAILPAVAKVADGVGALAGAFGSLPAPVTGAMTAVAGVAGISLLAVGGLLKLASAVVNTMDAFDTLAAKGGKGGGIIAGLGRNAARAAIPLALAVGTYAAAGKAAERSGEDINGLSKELQKFGQTGKVGTDLTDVFGKDLEGKTRSFQRDVRGIGDAIQEFKKYGDDNALTSTARKIGGVFGSGFVGSLTKTEGIYKSVEAIKDMDAAFVGLSRSKPDDAIKSFERLRDAALDQGAGVDDVAKAFPAMTEILQSASEAMGGTGDATEILNGNLTELAPTAQESAEELAAMQEAAQAVGESFFDTTEALKGSASGLSDFFNQQADALANFRQNAAEALRRGADEDLVEYLISKGPEGANMLDQLANGGKAAADTLSDSWRRSREEIADFVEFQTGVPKEIVTEFKPAGADGAIRTAAELADKYAELDEMTIVSVLEALDYSSEDIEAVLKLMREADRAEAKPTVDAQVGQALTNIQSVINRMGSVRSKEVTLTVKQNIERSYQDQGPSSNSLKDMLSGLNGGYTGMRVPQGFAGGGVVPGAPPADPREDNVLAFSMKGTPLRVRSGEWIINEKASDANDEWLRAINGGLDLSRMFGRPGDIPGFAEGGRLDRLNAQARVRDIQRDLREKERYGRKPKKGPDRRPKRYVLRGLDREIAREELKEARAELADLRKPRSKRKEAVEQRREDAKKAREERREDIASGTKDAMGNFDLDQGALRSPAAVERALQQSISDMATFTSLLIQLKKKGASPWLLQQLQGFGPSRGTIRYAQMMLKDNAALRRTNALAAQGETVAGIYGTVTTDAKWEANKAWSAPVNAGQQRSLDRASRISVQQTINPQPGMSEAQVAQMAVSNLQQAFR